MEEKDIGNIWFQHRATQPKLHSTFCTLFFEDLIISRRADVVWPPSELWFDTCGLTGDPDFGKKIIFSGEAHFELGGYVNKQNCRIWIRENSHAYIEKPMHPKRVTVWCGFWSRGIIGPFSSTMSKERTLQSMAIVIGPCWTNFCSQKWKRRILATFGFSRTALRATQPKLYSMFCALFLKIHYQPQSWCCLATSERRFDTAGLLFVGCCQR